MSAMVVRGKIPDALRKGAANGPATNPARTTSASRGFRGQGKLVRDTREWVITKT
jgi:hypothetical protein